MQLSPDLEKLVRRIADEQERPTEAVIADALREYVLRTDARGAFVAEAEAGWESYGVTRLHVTGPELDHWLGGWGKRVGETPPACHD
ncbi:hypothetical protein ASG43_15965 [Aureimonas sp. Leaf454]|uniref:hypothetical protein n=1 Tax=Aureimonas sp. Leaf454 TaxID=1736381 RepID=UPI0006FD540A|nr:hypothetical protein [Aureimonas sp. Leaf454]KQT43027.1 hypothetical protein ASG43_15965 [Aureimonas sp. Leaf454]